MTGALLLRADASARIGTGHVLRCIALAEAWQEVGGVAVLAAAALPDAVRERVSACGVDIVRIDSAVGSEKDASATAAAATRAGAAWVVVDGYAFDVAYQEGLRSPHWGLLAVDDHGRLDGHAADLVLDPNLGAMAACYPDCAPDALLLGSDYVLLRREFRERKDQIRRARERPCWVLVTLGGSDPSGVTPRALEAVLALSEERVAEVVVLLGGAAAATAPLPAAATDPRLRVQVNATNPAELMARADVAIAAAGSTTWELAFLGVPSLLTACADNQRPLATEAARAGAAVDLGWHAELTARALRVALADLIDDTARRATMAAAGRALVDGQGVQRVISAMGARRGG